MICRPLRPVLLGLFLFSFSLNTFADRSSKHVHPYITEYADALDIAEKSFEIEELKEALDLIKKLPTVDAYHVLSARIERIPSAAKHSEIPDLKKVVVELLLAFQSLGTAEDLDMIKDFTDWLKSDLNDNKVLNEANYTSMALSRENHPKTKLTLDKLNRDLMTSDRSSRQLVPVSSGRERVDLRKKGHELALAQVHKLYGFMRQRVVGQEHILRSLQGLYLEDTLRKGKRQFPEVFYLMGLPGNGKDTIAEAFVDAIWDQEGAHHDHMFRMNIRTSAEAWTYFGSAKGYVGSSELPAFLQFLVRQSGGRYMLVEEETKNNEKRLVVHKNPNWKPSEKNEEPMGPHRAVIFVNEAHNIPKEVKDNILKQAIERGIFPVNNPGTGPNAVSEIHLPVTFIFASNEGINLLEPRNRNGSRQGPPLSYEQLMENFERVFNDKPALKEAIMATNGQKNSVATGRDTPGVSEEFVNRIPSRRTHLLEPFSSEQLKEVAKLLAEKRVFELAQHKGAMGHYKVQISDEMIDFITSYKHIPSENARPLKDRLESFIFEPLYNAIQSGRIRALGVGQTLKVDIKKYERGPATTTFQVESETGVIYQFSRLIKESLSDLKAKPLSDERVAELLAIGNEMRSNVFGVDHIVDKLVESAIVTESEARNGAETSRPATLVALLGKTSTGKTETAKQYVKARYGQSTKPVIIDFNGVRSLRAMEEKILGSFDEYNNPIPSEFMKQYDRNNGRLAFIFDEAANAPYELLKGLYEILREDAPSGFSDGKSRPMKEVTIIVTGNAGEQIYESIPQGMPAHMRERAMHEIFRTFLKDDDLQHRLLAQTFPDAFLARLGQNIYHFGPLTDAGKRQITQLKLKKNIENLKAKPSERGWNVGFASEADLINTLNLIEQEAYRVESQGAGIDKFVRESFADKIKAQLLIAGVPSGSQVWISLDSENKTSQDKGTRFLSRELSLVDESGQTHKVSLNLGPEARRSKRSEEDRVLTAYHEAAHEIVSSVYMGDLVQPSYLSIIEGVGRSGSRFIMYEGVRMGDITARAPMTKEMVLRQAAVLTAGYVAQQLVTIGGRHDAGKSDDMLRATSLIQNAILRYGLSSRWGVRAIPEGVSTNDYIAKELSASEKQQLNSLTNEWLQEAERLSREALWANFHNLFIEMSKSIAENGEIYGNDIQALYERHGLLSEHANETHFKERVGEINQLIRWIDQRAARLGSRFQKRFTETNFRFEQAEEAYNFLAQGELGWLARLNPLRKKEWDKLSPNLQKVAASRISHWIETTTRDAHLASEQLMPKSVANVEALLLAKRAKETESVTRVQDFRVSEAIPDQGHQSLVCQDLFH